MAQQIKLLGNLTTDCKNTTTNHSSSEFSCQPYSNARFQTLTSSLPHMINAALNVPLAALTVLANVLVFLAIRRSASIRLPSKLLLCTLVLTDLGVGVFVQPQYLVFLVMKANKARSIACFSLKWYGFSGTMLAGLSLSTMTAVSVDRYIALFFHLKYREIVTARRVATVLTVNWSLCVFHASTWFWNMVLWQYGILNGFFVSLLVLSVAYIKIYRRLRHQHCHRVGDQAPAQETRNTLDVAKYRRTASTMLWMYVLFVLCYVPVVFTHFITAYVEHSALTQCIFEFSLTLVHLNSLLNPLLYCLRLPEIRADVLQRLQKCRQCCQRLSP